jgi:hypothetical protein
LVLVLDRVPTTADFGTPSRSDQIRLEEIDRLWNMIFYLESGVAS